MLQSEKKGLNFAQLESDFLENLNPLYKAVYDLGGVDFADLWNYTSDYYDPSTGSVVGLIYYDDTEPFAKDNFEEIFDLFEEIGLEIKASRKMFNSLTWSVWSLMVLEFEGFKESADLERYEISE